MELAGTWTLLIEDMELLRWTVAIQPEALFRKQLSSEFRTRWSWITIAWSMAAAACATLALIYLKICFDGSSQITHLLFALMAFGAAGGTPLLNWQ